MFKLSYLAITLSLIFFTQFAFAQSAADSLLNFIQQNKSRAALSLQQNGTITAHLNDNKLMPLASTVKILVAIEFAKQAAAGIFDAQKKVALNELDKYYLANTDGDAHPNWIRYEKTLNNIVHDSVRLIDVARGMIIFSSNANTEFLIDLLGIDNVNSNIKLLGLKNHSRIYPLVSSLFLYQNPKNYKEEKIIKELNKMSDEDYFKFTMIIHNELKFDPSYKNKFRPQDLSERMQKVWSDRLPASTTSDYVRISSIINNRKYFNPESYKILEQVLESVMENPANQQLFLHAGMKGGSTIFILTKSLYATLKDSTKIELAYFFNDLTAEENSRLQNWMNAFELRVLTDEHFRSSIKF